MSRDSIRARAAACDLPVCDVKALLSVADAAAEYLVIEDDLRRSIAALGHSATIDEANVMVAARVMLDVLAALAALDAQP